MTPLLELFRPKDACRLLTPLEGPQARRYRLFKNYLNFNHAALSALADLEQAYYGGSAFTAAWVRRKYEDLGEAVLGTVFSLEGIIGKELTSLENLVMDLDRRLEAILTPVHPPVEADGVIPFPEIYPGHRPLVGSKACNLALITSHLGLPAPPGFAVTAAAGEVFLRENGLEVMIERELASIRPDDLRSIDRAAGNIQTAIHRRAHVPPRVKEAMLAAWDAVEGEWGPGLRMAVRSSAIGEDTEASFAGQYETFLNVTRERLGEAYRSVLASKYSSRAIAYRIRRGLDDGETPMAVAGVAMLNPKSAGVLYTRDPAGPESGCMRINAVWGLGEMLVSGNASPDMFLIDRRGLAVVERGVSPKLQQLVNVQEGGTAAQAVPGRLVNRASISDEEARELARLGLRLEEYFGGPQDAEWAVDEARGILLLQSRPLELGTSASPVREEKPVARDYKGHPVLLLGGRAASPGVASGPVHHIRQEEDLEDTPPGAIVVSPTASPDLATLAGLARGVITEVGGVASHLASVAREFGMPALFDAPEAMSRLPQGQTVTLWSDQRLVYRGAVEELLSQARPARNLMMESPVHRRLRQVLDLVAPLNLTNPEAPGFRPAGCRTFHDVVRYTHETAVKAMFELGQSGRDRSEAVRLASTVPMDVRLIDMGGGLKEGLTTCDEVTPADITSGPMRSLWRGLSHPGVNWTSTVPVSMRGMVSLMAGGGLAGGGELGSASYAMISQDYLNFSARFGYHFANLDCLLVDNPSQNHLSLQFAGGAGQYHGRALRVQFLSEVLSRLGLKVTVKGDLLEANLTGHGREGMAERLDQVGRLLASSRLMDVGLANRAQVDRLVEAFFRKDYDYLSAAGDRDVTDFYTPVGEWTRREEDGRECLVVDGTRWRTGLSAGLAGLGSRLLGEKYYEFLDNIQAYHYFPMAVRKSGRMADGLVRCRVKAVSGVIDQTGGILFGLRDIGNFLVWRLNVLEQNLVLFRFSNAKRRELARVRQELQEGRWYELGVRVSGRKLECLLDGELLLTYRMAEAVRGFVGLWSKADSQTCFSDLEWGL